MLHNKGIFGPNDAHINIASSTNPSQMNAMSLTQNYNNINKSAQNVGQESSGSSNGPTYFNCGLPSYNIAAQMRNFQYGHGTEFPSQNSHSAYERMLQNNVTPLNLNVNCNKMNSVPDLVPVIDKNPIETSSTESDKVGVNISETIHDDVKLSCQSHTRPAEANMDARRKCLEKTVLMIEKMLMDSSEKKSVDSSQTKSKFNRNTMNDSSDDELYESDDQIMTDDCDSKQNTSKESESLEPQLSHMNVNIKRNTQLMDKKSIKPKSNQKQKSKNNNGSEQFIENIDSDSNCEPESTNKITGGKMSAHPELGTEDVDADIKTEKEDNIDVNELNDEIKMEDISINDEFLVHYRKDSNGVCLDDLDEANEAKYNVVDGETSVAEATEAFQQGSNPSVYYECPSCNILISNPKRFLIHNKWHSFGMAYKIKGIAKDKHNKKMAMMETKSGEASD